MSIRLFQYIEPEQFCRLFMTYNNHIVYDILLIGDAPAFYTKCHLYTGQTSDNISPFSTRHCSKYKES